MQDRGVQVRDMASILDRVETQVVSRSDGLAPLHTGACQPHRESERVVVATRLADAFTRRRAPEFAPPDQERLVPEAGPLQIGDQSRHRLVSLAGVQRMIPDAVAMPVPRVFKVPATRVELDKPHPALE